jgi:hypothetical protein
VASLARAGPAHSNDTTTANKAKVRPAMGFFKPDFYRFFVIGFAAGAIFVASTTDMSVGDRIANGVVPVAEAQVAR